ncbi:glutamine synthetase family protein [Streptomyces sp. SID8352]|uniref:glutamine synthetase family protein n=1 Tax=Streptomyces sp. SID8352 TaxID=2690338 RepID=UPI00136E4318|nr:glutamine synthetase family protein [Streptomyces sp. SID8352]MYU22608.1 glutamine synthetase [Streptomyces sp. SID8352]
MSEQRDWRAWAEENGIRSVRAETISLDGVASGKYLSARKFLSGMASGWSFCDVAFGVDLSNEPQLGFDFGAWRGEMGDVFLRPDPDTVIVDPSLPGLGAVICDLVDRDGSPLPVCARSALREQVGRLARAGYTARAAIEVEATVFEESLQEARAKRYRDLHPLGGGAGALYVLGRTGDFTAFMDGVSRRLDETGIPWEGWCDESAAGQIEFNIPPMDPLRATDTYNRVKLVMRQVASEQGHSVTFMAKWSPDLFGQGAHINLSLLREGVNAFHHADDPARPSRTMRHFVAGALDTMAAATTFSFPTVNSYRRIQELNGPPTTVTWGVENKTTAIRAICRDAGQSRLEYRVPSADANLYLAFAAFLAGGLIGLERGNEPRPALDVMAWSLPDGTDPIPPTLSRATDALARDTDLTGALGTDLVDYWIGTRRWEWLTFHTGGGDPDEGVSDWELRRYFELV